ncbi:MAG TPA: hypothetical protein VMU34_02065 [Mycobacterium sp.]|nr:hypothetical protein [Mycobacterium sp.]
MFAPGLIDPGLRANLFHADPHPGNYRFGLDANYDVSDPPGWCGGTPLAGTCRVSNSVA